MAPRTRRPGRPAPGFRPESEQAEANRVSASLAGLAAVLLFVVVGLVLVHRLTAEGRVEDCLMAGRTNCGDLIAAR